MMLVHALLAPQELWSSGWSVVGEFAVVVVVVVVVVICEVVQLVVVDAAGAIVRTVKMIIDRM